MKISKILAGMSAMALAASMMTIGASAAITNPNFNDGSDYCYDVFAAVGADKAATITSVRAKLSFKSIDDLNASGAGGGFITSSDGTNWQSVTMALKSLSHSLLTRLLQQLQWKRLLQKLTSSQVRVMTLCHMLR